MVLYNQCKKYFQIVSMDHAHNSDPLSNASSVKYGILRQLVCGNEEEQAACIEYLKDEVFLAYNINIVNLLSLQNYSKGLQ